MRTTQVFRRPPFPSRCRWESWEIDSHMPCSVLLILDALIGSEMATSDHHLFSVAAARKANEVGGNSCHLSWACRISPFYCSLEQEEKYCGNQSMPNEKWQNWEKRNVADRQIYAL